MAREPEDFGYYAIRDKDGNPKAMHCATARPPKDGIEISYEEACAISAAYRGPVIRRSKADPDGLAIAVLNEAKDQIVAVVNEASADRDKAIEGVMLRLQALEAVFEKLNERADTILVEGKE